MLWMKVLFVLFLFVGLCACDKGNTEPLSVDLPSLSSDQTNPFHFDKLVHDRCANKTAAFSRASSAFVACAISNARPVMVCELCSGRYLDIRNAYQDITSDQLQSDNCDEYLLNSDRVQVIKFLYQQMEQLWGNANCGNCFKNENNTLELTEETLKLEHHVNLTNECMNNHNKTICHADNKTCHNEACKNCSKTYSDMNDCYEKLIKQYGMLNLCMDLVDQVNNTRKLWSREFSCVHFTKDPVVLFCLVTFFCVCPVVFYLGSWIQSAERKSKIIPQKRLITSRSAIQLSIN